MLSTIYPFSSLRYWSAREPSGRTRADVESAHQRMPLSPGVRIGSYEIVATLGIGGMGEVYRARGTRLKRDVALEVLPEAVAGPSTPPTVSTSNQPFSCSRPPTFGPINRHRTMSRRTAVSCFSNPTWIFSSQSLSFSTGRRGCGQHSRASTDSFLSPLSRQASGRRAWRVVQEYRWRAEQSQLTAPKQRCRRAGLGDRSPRWL
jgi:hypothetical protein